MVILLYLNKYFNVAITYFPYKFLTFVAKNFWREYIPIEILHSFLKHTEEAIQPSSEKYTFSYKKLSKWTSFKGLRIIRII